MKNKTILLPGYVIPGGLFKTDIETLKSELAPYAGKPITIEIRLFAGEISEAFRAYYYNHVVKQFRLAFLEVGERFSEIQCDEFIRNNCAEASKVYYDHEINKRINTVYEVEEMSRAQLLDVIAWAKEYASVNMGYVISDNSQIFKSI